MASHSVSNYCDAEMERDFFRVWPFFLSDGSYHPWHILSGACPVVYAMQYRSLDLTFVSVMTRFSTKKNTNINQAYTPIRSTGSLHA